MSVLRFGAGGGRCTADLEDELSHAFFNVIFSKSTVNHVIWGILDAKSNVIFSKSIVNNVILGILEAKSNVIFSKSTVNHVILGIFEAKTMQNSMAQFVVLVLGTGGGG